MITRIVKMTFRKESTADFVKLFAIVSPEINKFKGCRGVQLFSGVNDERIFFTFSTWDDENSLENYRQSGFFKDTWQKTKPLFEAKAEAWTVQNVLK